MVRRDSKKELTTADRTELGFSVLEMSVVVLIISVILTIALPSTKAALKNYHLTAAVKDISGAIQSTRYLAIMKGATYNIAFDHNTYNYQIASKIPPAVVFSNVGNAVPWSVTNDVTLNPSTTLEFSPGGTIKATTGALTFTLTNGSLVETITVSLVGDISVTP